MTRSDRAALVLGTWFGCGLAPLAPGTVGSLGAIPLHLWLARMPAPAEWVAIGAVTALGTWAAGRVARTLGQEDPQRVVVDEVAGVLIALALVRGQGFWPAALAFGLFRLLDVTKLGPVGRAERLSPVGLAIMADDLVAGAIAGVLARLASSAVHWV